MIATHLGLSPRERDAVVMMLEGKKDGEIAAAFDDRITSVRTFIRRAIRKAGATSKAWCEAEATLAGSER